MSRRSVNVERLELRLRGVAPHAAREAAASVARALLAELARGSDTTPGSDGLRVGGGHARIERVEANARAADAGPADGDLHRVVARRVAEQVHARLR
jgi:hypothetical protein